jgi:hypothetical protein
MTTVDYVRTLVLPAAFTLLPPSMDALEARALVLAIGFQESEFKHRDQVDAKQLHGPALGFWQFEVGGGVAGVLTHPTTRVLITRVCDELRVVPAASACWRAIEHNDILAAVFARLNLWWVPEQLPREVDVEEGWRQYDFAWNPGRPHPEKWPATFARGWAEARKG